MLGPNGAGKTSTIEALEGLRASGRRPPVGGGGSTRRPTTGATAGIGVMLQEGGIHPAVRVGRGRAARPPPWYPDPRRPRTSHLTGWGWAGLEGAAQPAAVGRRAAGGWPLALALVGRPQVAFLDEPDGGVDPAGRQVIRHVVAELRNAGVTVLLTTHDLDEAERVADRVGDRGWRPAGRRRHRRRAQPTAPPAATSCALPGAPAGPRPTLARHAPRRRRRVRDRPRRVPRVRRT